MMDIDELADERMQIAEQLGVSVTHHAAAVRHFHEEGEMDAAIKHLEAIDAAINKARQARLLPARPKISLNQDMIDIVQCLVERINDAHRDNEGRDAVEELATFLLRKFTIHEICDHWELNDDDKYVFTDDGENVSRRVI